MVPDDGPDFGSHVAGASVLQPSVLGLALQYSAAVTPFLHARHDAVLASQQMPPVVAAGFVVSPSAEGMGRRERAEGHGGEEWSGGGAGAERGRSGGGAGVERGWGHGMWVCG